MPVMTELAKIAIESVPDLCTGFLSIVQLFDVSSVTQILLPNNTSHTSDIDDITCDSTNLTISINGNCLVKLTFENYIYATNMINECDRMYELKFSLTAIRIHFSIRARIGTRNIILAN